MVKTFVAVPAKGRRVPGAEPSNLQGFAGKTREIFRNADAYFGVRKRKITTMRRQNGSGSSVKRKRGIGYLTPRELAVRAR